MYIPESKPYQGIETFTIEGQPIKRDYKNIIAKGWIGPAPQRWIYLGTHANNGTLDVAWTQASSVRKIFIRQLPTVAEAATWLQRSHRDNDAPPAETGGSFIQIRRLTMDLCDSVIHSIHLQ